MLIHFIRRASPVKIVLLVLTLLVSACGSSSKPEVSTGPGANEVVTPADYPGITNAVPPAPASGSRAGQVYNVYIQGPVTGDKIALTVFEPTTMVAGRTYPLVLYSHGLGNPRVKSADDNINSLISAGYGVISIDQRGHGESTGTIRVMDPDAEGQNLIAIVDWAEARLSWLAYGPSADGRDKHNLMLGSMGESYSGIMQYLLHNIDPRNRLDAIIPEIAPNDLKNALFPQNTVKFTWDAFLFTAPTVTTRSFDPYVTNEFISGLLANQASASFNDFLYYHSNQYFCDSIPVATNGGAGTVPKYAPKPGPLVHAMIFQGVRDTLFNLSEGIQNYNCLKSLGGDVRLLSFQSGHNNMQFVPDLGNRLYFPPGNEFDTSCGSIAIIDARRKFFDEHLKGITGAANTIPKDPCLSIAQGDAVTVRKIMTKDSGSETAVVVPDTTVIAGMGLDTPVSVDLGIVGGTEDTIVAGVPHLEVIVTPVTSGLGEPVVLVGLGQTHNGVPGAYDLINNQLQPLRGDGTFNIDLVGIAARLKKGDHLALLFYGMSSQFLASGSINVASPAIVPVTIKGKVWVPVLPEDGFKTVQ